MYVYSFHYPKEQLEHVKLAKVLQTKGLKILCNVRTQWISMLAPNKHVLTQYKSLVVKMGDDMARNASTKNNYYEFLCDGDTALGLTCVLPMLEGVQSLSKLAQRVRIPLFVTW
jgi:hypothetical protein